MNDTKLTGSLQSSLLILFMIIKWVWLGCYPRGVVGEMENKTLFVRNLPYSCQDKDLETAFSHYGAVLSCFTAKDKGSILEVMQQQT